MVDVIEEIKDNVKKGGESIEEIFEEGTEVIEKGLKKSKEVIKDIAKKGKKAVEDVVEEGAEAIEKGAGKSKKAVEDVIEEGVEAIEKGAGKSKKAIEEIFEEGAETVKKTAKKGKKAVKDVIEEGDEAVKKVKRGIKKTIEREKIKRQTVGEIIDDVSENKTEKLEENKVTGKELEKTAEKESLKTEEKDIEEQKKELLEKAKKLSEKVDITKTEDLKEQVKIKKRADMLIPLEEYVKAGIYLGTKVVTPDMKPFVYRRRADGLAIFNTDLIDEKLKEGIEYLSKFNPKDIVLVCKRQAGWKAAKMFSHLTGIRVFTKKYPAGILTNTELPDFFENELTIITDSWLDKNALKDTVNVHKEVLMICDTNNFSKGADQIIIGNNKSAKSLGVIFYLLARGFCKAKDIQVDIPELEWWTSEGEV